MNCLAAGSPLEDFRSSESIHDLYEIDQAARAFVATENARDDTAWTVAEPNLKTLVARCSVPLDTRWGEIRLFAPSLGARSSKSFAPNRSAASAGLSRCASPVPPDRNKKRGPHKGGP
ncbi:hypothetical protein [Pseudomonas nitroreducens]|uniref:hypothetical protein n=1 Tax=Pseudomonas nitroreducens TaxID=46680 RepID=UPI00209D81FE|nr:hypothetical protein [Pseudomonas nitroreducens]MCP1626906.1 hypothetical protein [Pseudomonas nitroreducens]